MKFVNLLEHLELTNQFQWLKKMHLQTFQLKWIRFSSGKNDQWFQILISKSLRVVMICESLSIQFKDYEIRWRIMTRDKTRTHWTLLTWIEFDKSRIKITLIKILLGAKILELRVKRTTENMFFRSMMNSSINLRKTWPLPLQNLSLNSLSKFKTNFILKANATVQINDSLEKHPNNFSQVENLLRFHQPMTKILHNEFLILLKKVWLSEQTS